MKIVGVFLEMFEELGTTEMMGTGASIHWDVVSWWHWCLAAFLSPENVEKTNHPSGNGKEKVLKSSSSFLPKTREEQRSVNKIYPLN